MKDQHLVVIVPEMLQAAREFRLVVDQVADDDHQRPPADALGHLVQHGADVGVLLAVLVVERLEHPAELRRAALRMEGARRRPEVMTGEGGAAATLRAMVLVASVVLSRAGAEGAAAVAAVRAVLAEVWRASSSVEGINSVLRMQQSRHRRLTQGLLDLKRLYWNSHEFRTGKRKGQSPYSRLGVVLPALSWWEILKLSPEALRLLLPPLGHQRRLPPSEPQQELSPQEDAA